MNVQTLHDVFGTVGPLPGAKSTAARLTGVTYVGADLAGDVGPEEYARAAEACRRHGLKIDPAMLALIARDLKAQGVTG